MLIASDVKVNPTSTGLPGGAMVQKLLDWTGQIALWGSVGAILVGAAMYGLAREGGSYQGASKGKSVALGGLVGTILAGIAPAAVNGLFHASR
jgi:hypothetical protein